MKKRLFAQKSLAELTLFFRKNTVMVIAFLAALVTMVLVPPDKAYASYFDCKTLACLFCVLATVCALKNIRFFYLLARKIVTFFKDARMSVLALVYITFIGSMLIANDMALLTFLPLGFYTLDTCGKQKYMAFTFIMQNIAANLGGMLTPFGNPQNLYLYTKFNIPNLEFMRIMAPPFVVSVALITLCCLVFVKPEPLETDEEIITLSVPRTVLYLALFALSIAIVFRGIPYVVGLILIPAVLFFADRKALRMVDYPLLLTFVFFFIFAGNMARLEPVRTFFSWFLNKNTLVFLPVHQQCAVGDSAFAVYGQLSGSACRRQHRRCGNVDCVACKLNHLSGICGAQSAQSRQIHCRILGVQLCVSVCANRLYAVFENRISS